jgi:glycosyltransferase involved in cell wall biosynthesis
VCLLSQPLVSIGTRAYNAEKTIVQTIESVLSQSMSDFEYWIINNGSTDRTGEILDQYAAKDKRIHVIHSEVNHPFVYLLGILVERGQGQYFMLLDSDDWLEQDFIRELYNHAILYKLDIAVSTPEFI